jgi:hypothetical protein
MMNKSLLARERESSGNRNYGFQRPLQSRVNAATASDLCRWHGEKGQKRAAVSGGFKVDNREASNRVDRSHSVSKEDAASHTWESLINRKRAIFFRLCLPCRSLAEFL